MTRRKQIFLTAALMLCIAAAVWLCRPVKAEIIYQDYITAAQNIKAGQQIELSDLNTISLPAGNLVPNYPNDPEIFAGEIATVSIAEGELISSGHTGSRPAGVTYPYREEGTRLMTIEVSAGMANGYWLAAGSRVDIDLVSGKTDEEHPVISLENIEVAAVLSADEVPHSYNYGNQLSKPLICLALDREQALILVEGLATRDLHLSVICPG